MIHAGIGETHVNAFLSTIGIPPLNGKTLKKLERKVGIIIENEAKLSCVSASQAEYAIAMEAAVPTDQISFDEALELLENQGL